ncbi:hypothetical protein [Labrenzia sp. PHM005]|uniref:hypothetical protein n=1 Tax=Labrenzia sp. PHM005 TaxID=2590016 RepID=UPI0011405C43|nr:hypothetical protein [Labrenzia sp. PHM005]QDG77121.1 hypothetical protein FJ695_15245 [Labrenzia sp. PHM005]
MFFRLTAIAFIWGFTMAPANSETIGSWHSEKVNGYQSYWTKNQRGSRFTIWCPDSKKSALPLIGIDIKGRLPAPETLIRVELDRRLIKFTASEDGYIRPDCAACGDKLRYFWQLLRNSARFAVLFDEDRRYAGFSTIGAGDIIPANVCATNTGLQAKRQ